MPIPLLTALSLTRSTQTSEGASCVTSDGRALPLVGAKLRIAAQGGIARATLEQTFANRFDETLHVTYRMPLPADGAVSGYAFRIGERTIAGVVDKKAAAREKFEQAIASGHTAGLLEQERDDIFTQKLGNLPAGETLVAMIAVDQRLAWLPEGEWELRFPTVIGPRYTNDEGDARATSVETRVEGIAARIQIEIAIGDVIVDGRKPTSPTHALTIGDGGYVTLKDAAKLDRDIVVRWPVAARACGLTLATARGHETSEMYGLVTIVPPARAAKAKPVARDLLILLDTSGSMGGAPLDKAQQVLPLLVETLGEGDRIEMIEFSDEPRRWKPAPVAAGASEKAAAIKWIRSRRASGGTEMRAAVIEALATLRLGSQRQVVVVTDGYVGGEQQILEVLHARLPKSCRLHVLGVGSAVNRSLACALARAGRGAEVLVGPDEDAERGAKRLLDRTKAPMLTNVEIFGTGVVRHAPEHVPDVFEGAPLVAGVMIEGEGGEVVVRGELAGGEVWEQRVKVAAKAAGEGDPGVIALYGREHVADLEARAAMDYGAHDREIEDTGVKFQIATRLTSWVAVDMSRVVAKGPARNANVPQELPYGTHAAAFGLRAASAAAAAMNGPVTGQMAAVAGFSEVDEEIASSSYDMGDDDQTFSVPAMEKLGIPAQPKMPAPAAPAKTRAFTFGAKKEAKEAEAPKMTKTVMLSAGGGEGSWKPLPPEKEPPRAFIGGGDKEPTAAADRPAPAPLGGALRQSEADPNVPVHAQPSTSAKQKPGVVAGSPLRLVMVLLAILALIALLLWWLA